MKYTRKRRFFIETPLLNCIKLRAHISFCTFSKVIPVIEKIAEEGADIIPIMSEAAYFTDTRFGESEKFVESFSDITGKEIIKTITEAEPIGPKKLLDILLIIPCTGNTLAKLSHGICDSTVTLAVKAHLRNNKPVVIAVSTNDGLGTAAENIGRLLNRKNMYFVPFGQDDCVNKPNSLVADFKLAPETIKKALGGEQIQPILLK